MGKKQSRFGIASVILSLLILVFIFLGFLGNIIYGKSSLFDSFINIFTFPEACFSTMILSGIALASGIVGLFEKNRNKFFAILGIGFSILSLIAELFAYLILEGLSAMIH